MRSYKVNLYLSIFYSIIYVRGDKPVFYISNLIECVFIISVQWRRNRGGGAGGIEPPKFFKEGLSLPPQKKIRPG